MKSTCFFAAGVALAALASPTFAQQQQQQAAGTGDYHAAPPQDIVVTAAPFARNVADILSGTSVLTGEALTRTIRPTIGETLAKLPGVSATSFGPNASRPILRGFQGERVRILTDGIGSFDASNTSVDHAVVINPLTSDRIEVLRGPASLLYGSSAIGGVVNVIDSRIPTHVPDEPIHIDAIGSYGSAANERSGSGAIQVPVGDKIVLHADGSYSKTGDLETGGHILSPALRAEAAASDDPEIAALADLKGKLPNSSARTWEVAGGAALITEGGNLGFSVSRYDSLYAVPIRYSLEPGAEAEAVRIDVKQTRADLRGEVETGGGLLDRIRLRAGFADYQHSELEEDGAVGTTFFNKSIESRLEFVQAERGGWRGAFGGQLFIRDFDVIGEEAFVPRNETLQAGLFTLQSFDIGALRAELGGRYEHSKVSADASEQIGNPDISRSFDAFSGSAGASLAVAPGLRLGLNVSRTERAPSAEELFANGPHAGTQSFELGNPGFSKEKSWGVEGTLRFAGDGYNLALSGYHSWFSDYIYDAQMPQAVCEAAVAPGREIDLPCFQYNQADARYYGFEAEASARVAQIGGYAINLDGVADYVHAKINSVGPAPRIPPLRLLGGIEAQGDMAQGRIELEHVFEQDRVTSFETPTGGYTMVNASVSLKPFGPNNGSSLILSANNIFDVVARRHASFLKDHAPLAGRDLRVTARFAF
ncbi:TonB-dependent receptor [Sphingomonas oleivorans]|uniref:TonB-dependent receptor n=1 Tax=Sphingomonas oleivorans TaxID=1735121 RepID=A0A2T5FXG3_9SPHN|nr:TonB-dependent receptor [Sphingomonas oleivorans]PTQ10825.1 TonB-dependent receptor [Sphingomonas oleivorans]